MAVRRYRCGECGQQCAESLDTGQESGHGAVCSKNPNRAVPANLPPPADPKPPPDK